MTKVRRFEIQPDTFIGGYGVKIALAGFSKAGVAIPVDLQLVGAIISPVASGDPGRQVLAAPGPLGLAQAIPTRVVEIDAAVAVGGRDRQMAEALCKQVVQILEESTLPDEIPTVETVQDIVEKVLIENSVILKNQRELSS